VEVQEKGEDDKVFFTLLTLLAAGSFAGCSRTELNPLRYLTASVSR
jgi:hypothetical protein